MSHITIAPLDAAPFNRFKSQVKYLEAGVLRRATGGLPDRVQDYVVDGRTALLARSDDEWAERLEELVVDDGSADVVSATTHGSTCRRGGWTARPGDQFADVRLLRILQLEGVPAVRVLIVNVHFSPDSFGGATIVAEQTASRLQASVTRCSSSPPTLPGGASARRVEPLGLRSGSQSWVSPSRPLRNTPSDTPTQASCHASNRSWTSCVPMSCTSTPSSTWAWNRWRPPSDEECPPSSPCTTPGGCASGSS